MTLGEGRRRAPARALAGRFARTAVTTVTAASAAAVFPAAARAADVVSGATGAGALAQAGLGLFAVIALILGLAWVARRAGLVRHANAGVLKVIGSTMLGARQRLLLVEVGDTWLVLGVSAGEIRTLHTLPAGSVPRADALAGASFPSASSDGTFAQRLLRSMQQNLKS